jgi:hypothetical protein
VVEIMETGEWNDNRSATVAGVLWKRFAPLIPSLGVP